MLFDIKASLAQYGVMLRHEWWIWFVVGVVCGFVLAAAMVRAFSPRVLRVHSKRETDYALVWAA